MRNLSDPEDEHDYSPNELAGLSSSHKSLHDQIINSNLELGDSMEDWQQRNLERAQDYLAQQRRNRY